jgi:hypothetical protein
VNVAGACGRNCNHDGHTDQYKIYGSCPLITRRILPPVQETLCCRFLIICAAAKRRVPKHPHWLEHGREGAAVYHVKWVAIYRGTLPFTTFTIASLRFARTPGNPAQFCA